MNLFESWLSENIQQIARERDKAISETVIKKLKELGYSFESIKDPLFLRFAKNRLSKATFVSAEEEAIYLDFKTDTEIELLRWSTKTTFSADGNKITITVG